MKLDIKLLAICVAAIALPCGILFLLEKAHAATPVKTEATQRDWQRLNACTNASIHPDVKPEAQVSEAIRCAAFGKAVSHIESANGTSKYSKTRNNHYGIRYWDKAGRPHIKTYKTTASADADFARIYFSFYRGFGYKRFATKWTGEPHVIKAYAVHLNKWVPEYTKLYKSMTK